MKSKLVVKFLQNGVIAIVFGLFLGCNQSDDQKPIEEDDSLFFDFTLDGVQYKSIIKLVNLVPGSGAEYPSDPSSSVNWMYFNIYGGPIFISIGSNCGELKENDCMVFEAYLNGDPKVGVFKTVTNYLIAVNGQRYVPQYNGPNVNPEPSLLKTEIEITKFDEANSIMEGIVNGQYYKDEDPSVKVYMVKGKFRVYIYKG
jgi:hypothetical protein